jgi:hypothetical protein
MKNKYRNVGTVPISNRQVMETEMKIHNMQLYLLPSLKW